MADSFFYVSFVSNFLLLFNDIVLVMKSSERVQFFHFLFSFQVIFCHIHPFSKVKKEKEYVVMLSLIVGKTGD